VTVRQRIDQLAAEPPVRDLGYPADQRLVAGALLGLQLLADEIDALRAGRVMAADTDRGDDRDHRDHRADRDHQEIAIDVDIADMREQLADLTAQVKKLTKAVKRCTGKPKKKQEKKSKKWDDSPERG